ncbi:MAG TPA: hypothetical protein VMV19_07885 [Xanthobacteraceae bacterium]|nr:hypothetical protein [Xanthobacteraceae bacterium]
MTKAPTPNLDNTTLEIARRLLQTAPKPHDEMRVRSPRVKRSKTGTKKNARAVPESAPLLFLRDIETNVSKDFFELIADVLPDLVFALIDSLPGNFIAAAHEPVIGTKHSIVRFRFIPELFDQEVRAAVRAFRLQNETRNITRHCESSFVTASAEK